MHYLKRLPIALPMLASATLLSCTTTTQESASRPEHSPESDSICADSVGKVGADGTPSPAGAEVWIVCLIRSRYPPAWAIAVVTVANGGGCVISLAKRRRF